MGTRGIQAAIAVVGVVILAIGIYVWGVPQRHEPETPQAPVAAAPSETPAPNAAAPAPGPVPNAPNAPNAPTSQQATTPSTPPASPPAQGAPPADPAKQPPAFDVVRVEPDGSSVVAGRAPPGAKVELLRNGQPVGEATADPSGAFAMTPPALPPGTHELSLRVSSNGREAKSGEEVTVVVADDRKTAPIVALTAPDKPTVVLSKPEGAAAATGAPPATGQAAGQSAIAQSQNGPAIAPVPAALRPSIVIETVEADAGRMFVSGRAAAAATIRLYLNDTYLASARAAADGRLSFTIAKGLAPGDYRVRLDDVEPQTGKVLSRAEVAFTMPVGAVASAAPLVAADRPASASPSPSPVPQIATNAGSAPAALGPQAPPAVPGMPAPPPGVETGGSASAVVIPEVQTATVTRGDSLWRISRRTYGRGARYTVIYDANQDQIRDADLIYPGQVFVLPNEQRTGARAQ
ncbi:Ig-like domain-containing protein [Chelatococcus sp. GCM10030263]|uniref:Ig-like domain-containing protein n=1 Tax=Chelatococcus sp. GCM10030263 TaxID=3273387 RepID=UPI00361AE2F2